MDICEAIEIVLGLARSNLIIPTNDKEIDINLKQIEACDTLEDFAVNYLGED